MKVNHRNRTVKQSNCVFEYHNVIHLAFILLSIESSETCYFYNLFNSINVFITSGSGTLLFFDPLNAFIISLNDISSCICASFLCRSAPYLFLPSVSMMYEYTYYRYNWYVILALILFLVLFIIFHVFLDFPIHVNENLIMELNVGRTG